MSREKKKLTVLDLFSGCGGLSIGLETAGFDIKLGIDNWDKSLETFQKNHKNSEILCSDLSKLSPQKIEDKFLKNGVDVVVGGPPCQGFSISGKRDVRDPRNDLYKSFVLFVKYFKPKAFILENVPNLVSMDNGKVKDQIISEFEKLGYKVVYKILLASDFGVPQNRKRVIFVGLKNKSEFQYPKGQFVSKKVTSSEAISDLPESDVADGNSYANLPKSDYQKSMRRKSKGVFNHKTTKHTEKTIKIINLVPDGKNYKSLPKNLQGTPILLWIPEIQMCYTRRLSSACDMYSHILVEVQDQESTNQRMAVKHGTS